jgi:hypothetical protein
MSRADYLNRGLSDKTLLICDLWETGMNHAEIAAKLDVPMTHVYDAIYRGRQAGLKLRPLPLKKIDNRGLSARYQVLFGSVPEAIKGLPEAAMIWLLKNTPDGMTVAEYMTAFVLDAYLEENEE